MARKNPTPESKGAFGWNTTAYANFNTLQKIIFWLWPLAMLNYVFIVYWLIVFLGNGKKPIEDRRETYVKALYYFNIFWLCAVAVLVAVLAFNERYYPEAQPCNGFYCESQTPLANDERCENPAYILGNDDACHQACGNTRDYCEENSWCFRNECATCPAGSELYTDGMCYETA